jgi:hypothetical protein
MAGENDEFEVLPGDEMRRKYYSPSEAPPMVRLDPSKVPLPLRELVPLAERWGISDDILREDYVSQASPEDVTALRQAVNSNRRTLNEWLAGPEADSPPFSAEYLAFTHLKMAADGY